MSDGIIGSVGVSVVPDADNFWRRFEERTRAGAAESGRRAGNDWSRGFRAGAGEPTVNVRVNTKQAQKDTTSLLGILGTLAPAVVPLSAAAALGGAALVQMGAAGALAFKGIQADIKAANADGVKFAAGLNVLKGDLHGLEQTAAHNVLGAFQQATAKLHAQLPALNKDIAQSSQVLGSIAGHLVGGLIGGLHNFSPALLAIEHGVDGVAAKFESWATGPGGAKFSNALIEDFQHVEPLIENLSTAIAHLVAGANGPGLAIVDELNVFAKILDAIPTPVLGALTAGIVSLRVASIVTGLMDKLAVSIRGVAVAEGEAAAASSARGGLAGVVGFLGKVGAGYLAASIGIDAYAKATDGARTSSDTFTRVVAQTGHALDQLVHFDFKGFGDYLFGGASKEDQIAQANDDLANSYHKMTGQLYPWSSAAEKAAAKTKALSQHQIVLVDTLAAGHAVFAKLSFGEEIASERTKDLTENARALAGVFDQLHGKLGGGAQISQVAAGYNAAGQAIQANVTAGEKFLKLGGKTIDTYHGVTVTLDMYKVALAKTGSDAGAIGYIQAQIDALGKNKAALEELAKESANVATYMSDVGTKYKLTAGQVDVYTAALGLNIAEIAKGGPALRNAEAELGQFVGTLKNGSTALDGWLAAVTQFSQSADTAADRATLIGAALKAANGDMLGYANTLVQASTANQQLVTDFKHLKDGVLNLKTGALDFHNAAAAPVLSDLQNLQTAAMNSASAVYQHFNALGDASAGDKAFATYVNDTRGALIGQATQLGLTHTEAKKLADQYFGIKHSGDIKKQIELIGKDEVLTTLKGILTDLDILAGKHVTSYVDVITSLNPGGIDNPEAHKRNKASGGYISGPGSGTSDSINARLSNGEFVVNAAQTAKHRNLLESINSSAQGFAAGGSVGGPDGTNPFTGVDYSGNANKYGVSKQKKGPGPTYTVAGQKYSSFQAAENAASRLFKAEVQLGVKIDDKDLTSFRAALKGTVSQARSAFATLYADAKKLGISDALAKTLRVENARLDSAVSDRNKAVEKLKTVNDEFKQVHDSVLQAGQGSFDLTASGTGFDGQQPVTFDNIQAQQTQAANLVKAWAAGIKKLAGVFGKSATGKAMLQQLAEGGPGDYPEVKALLSASPKNLASLASTQAQINSTSSGLGNFVGNELYGSQIKHLKAEIKIDEATVTHLADKIGKQVKHAVDDLADRPVKIYINGREIATAAAAGTKINARRT